MLVSSPLNPPSGDLKMIIIAVVKLILENGEEMQEVLDKANELGIMLKSTEAFMEFNSIKEVIDRDKSAIEILAGYNAAAEKIQLKQQNGLPIEGFEQEQFREFTREIMETPLLKDYLIKRDNYMGLLMLIHEAMNIGQGE